MIIFIPMNCWIGTDEAGKGDYFGGLAIAGVVVDNTSLPKLKELGVKDSKKLSDTRVKDLSKAIKQICHHSVVLITPPKYNELYAKVHNLNRILAWGHARVIENLLSEVECDFAVADKFGDKSYIENALMEKGRKITLTQRIKGEEDIAVASASILARATFLENLANLSSQIGVELPKGATIVKDIAKKLVQEQGEQILNKIAKIHFKTTLSVAAKAEEKQADNTTSDTQCQPVPNSSDGSGMPNACGSMQRLWAPWRIKYIKSPPTDKCIFCEALSQKDEECYILYRGKTAFVVMNLFPYVNGHLMVAPYKHTEDINELSLEETGEVFKLLQKCVAVLTTKLSPDGFNIGLNIGKVAGAGVKDHLHIHIVPRWLGDTNFMPITSETKVISQALEETYNILIEEFRKSE